MARRKTRSLEEVQATIASEVAELKEVGLVKWVRLNPKKAVFVVFVFGFLLSALGGGAEVVNTAVDTTTSLLP